MRYCYAYHKGEYLIVDNGNGTTVNIHYVMARTESMTVAQIIVKALEATVE